MAGHTNITTVTDVDRIARLESALAELVLANTGLLSRKKLYRSPALRELLELHTGEPIDPTALMM